MQTVDFVIPSKTMSGNLYRITQHDSIRYYKIKSAWASTPTVYLKIDKQDDWNLDKYEK